MRLQFLSILLATALISTTPVLSLGEEYQTDPGSREYIIEQTPSDTSSPGGYVDTETSSPGGNVDTDASGPGYVTEPNTSSPGGNVDTDTSRPGYVTEPGTTSPSYVAPDTTTSPGYVREPDASSPGGYIGDKDSDRTEKSERHWNYIVFKGGAYYPSESFNLDNIATTGAAGTTATVHFNNRIGFAGEVAYGRYILPVLAIELGAGYFQSQGVAVAQTGRTMLRVVPIVATGKFLLPLGPFEPYALGGIGAYISDLDVSGNINNFKGTTEVTYGLHAGAGFNINFTDRAFAGLEGKYLWVEPSFGGRHIRMDGFITTLNVGFRF
ncbi:MAG TPA: hypothetical protein VGJ93_13445 [Desulfuromonadaceae bacterium]